MSGPAYGFQHRGHRMIVGWSVLVLLALGGCASGTEAATTVSATTRSIPTPDSPAAATPTSQIAPPSAATMVSATSTASSAAQSRAADEQLVITWWATTINLRLHRTADRSCVGGVVAQLDGKDLALLVSAARSKSGPVPTLSAAGDALGPELFRCLASGEGIPMPNSSAGPAMTTGSAMPAASGECLLTAAEMSSMFSLRFDVPTHRVHAGPLGSAHGCNFQATGSTDHSVSVVVYDKVVSSQLGPFEKKRAQYVKRIPNFGDAAYLTPNSLDVLIGQRLLSIDQRPLGDEDAMFAVARLLLTKLN